MKVYISADIEGVTGSTHRDETDKANPDFTAFSEQMTAEVAAACEGALKAGASEILVKDAHASARNINARALPVEARLVRGWSGHPYCMVDGIDDSFQAMLMIGYHSRAGLDTNPLAHTISGSDVHVKINDQYASEFMINTYTAALVGVPVVFTSGDAGLCVEASQLVPGLTSVAVKVGLGNSTNNIHPQLALERIREGVYQSLKGDPSRCLVKLPNHFKVEIRYHVHYKAYSSSFYPGATLVDPFTIQYEAKQYFDVLRFFSFVF
jgi:D-amino peptidase